MEEAEGGLEGIAEEAEGNGNELEDNDEGDKGGPNEVRSVDEVGIVGSVSKTKGEIETKGVGVFTVCEAEISCGEVETNSDEVNKSPGDESE